jgi:FkbM family methyltransferase
MGVTTVSRRRGLATRWAIRLRNGLHPLSAAKLAAGRFGDIRFHGRRIVTPRPAGTGDIALSVWAGEYDAPGFVPVPGDRVVDVGGNVGVFAMLAAVRGARVESYEPHPETFAFLQANTAPWGVVCRHAAVVPVAPENGTVTLWLHPSRETRHSLLDREVETGQPLADSIEVPAVGLAEAVGAGCDLLKLDCEGAEFPLLLETGPETLRKVRRLVAEVHTELGDVEALAARLSELGFRTFASLDTSPSFAMLLFAERQT